MNINPIGVESIISGAQSRLPALDSPFREQQVSEEGRTAFESFFQAALNVIDETNYAQYRSDVAQVNFATGQDTNMLTVILAQERANSTLNFTVQVTNRIIEAYREIMRMQA